MSETKSKGKAEVRHNKAECRFEAWMDSQMSLLAYRETPGCLVLFHTEVPPELRGHGLASMLAEAALEFARSHHFKVVPQCPFVASFLKEHPEYADLAQAVV